MPTQSTTLHIAQDKINAVLNYAKSNVFNLDDVKDVMSGNRKPAYLDPERECWLGDYRVIYSLETQPRGLMHHVSISVHQDLPTIKVATAICEAFGLKTIPEDRIPFPQDSTIFWVEHGVDERTGQKFRAINILQLVAPETVH